MDCHQPRTCRDEHLSAPRARPSPFHDNPKYSSRIFWAVNQKLSTIPEADCHMCIWHHEVEFGGMRLIPSYYCDCRKALPVAPALHYTHHDLPKHLDRVRHAALRPPPLFTHWVLHRVLYSCTTKECADLRSASGAGGPRGRRGSILYSSLHLYNNINPIRVDNRGILGCAPDTYIDVHR